MKSASVFSVILGSVLSFSTLAAATPRSLTCSMNGAAGQDQEPSPATFDSRSVRIWVSGQAHPVVASYASSTDQYASFWVTDAGDQTDGDTFRAHSVLVSLALANGKRGQLDIVYQDDRASNGFSTTTFYCWSN